MLVQGDLDATDVASLLRGMQQERATGTLSVSDGTRECSLYFLFGHLFHAVGDGREGEAAVLDALGWQRGSFSFDARAKLPPEETITASTADLLAEWDRQRVLTTSAAAFDDTPPGPSALGEQPGRAAGTPDGEPLAAAASAPLELPPVAPAPAVAAATPSWSERAASGGPPTPEPAPAASPSTPEVSPPTMPLPSAVPEPSEITPSPAAAPMAPAATAAPSTRVVGTPDGPGLDILLPLPNGVPQNSGLKSNFLNFPRMLRAISDDHLTGYIRLREDGREVAHLLMREGDVLAAAHADGNGVRGGAEALGRMASDIAGGRGLVDVVTLPDPTTLALCRLAVAVPMITGLLARYVNVTSLLEYLGEERTTGSVVVITPEDRGVLLLEDGSILAAYTLEHPDQVAEPEPVAALCSGRQARIEVLRCQPRDIPAALDLAAVDRAGSFG